MGNVVAFIISFGIFLSGLWLIGNAFTVAGTGIWMVSGGILLVALALFIPLQILGISKKDHP